MIAWLILLAMMVGPSLLRWPVWRREGGTGGRNNLFYWECPPTEVTLAQGQSPAGRDAQEESDFVHRWVVALLLTSPVWFLPVTFLWQVAASVLCIAAAMWPMMAKAHFDLVGHGVEIIVAEAGGWQDYRAAEIERMRLRSSAFRGWTVERIDAGLRKRKWLSRLFVWGLRL